MLSLVLDVDVFEVGLSAEGEALGDVAYRYNHLFILDHPLQVLDLSVDELFV